MNSRMERYKSESVNEINEQPTASRVNKNARLYQDIKTSELSRIRNNSNVKVIENKGKTIDIDKIKRYIETNNKENNVRRPVRIETPKEVEEVRTEEKPPKDYDLNSVLEKAKQSREIDYDRERYKKLRDTQYDILSKIEMYEKETPSKEALEEEFNTDERTLIDLINTVTIHKGDLNLLEELVGEEGEETTEPIEKEIEKANKDKEEKQEIIEESAPKVVEVNEKKLEEIEKTQELVNLKEKTMEIDNSFYTNSMSFSKKDFEGFDELEKSVKKNSILSTIIIVLIVIFIIITLVLMANYVFDLGLF